jgi:hypothetical protein
MASTPDPNATSMVQRKLQNIIIPRLEFREATVSEALDFLKHKASSLDTDDPGRRGVNIVLNAPDETRITVALTNVSLGDALRYVTNLAGLKYKVEQYAVTVVPLSTPIDTLITKEFRVPRGFLAAAQAAEDKRSGGSGLTNRLEARDYLVASGIAFPPGSSAIYLPGSGKLIVKNTQENIDLVDAIVESSIANGPPSSGAPKRQVGFLPMKLELPKSGKQIAIEGPGAPDEIRLTYTALEARGQRHWLLFLLGAVAFLTLKGRHPWWRTAWVILQLSAIPLCFSTAATAACNILLAGWVTALFVDRLARHFIFKPAHSEAAV